MCYARLLSSCDYRSSRSAATPRSRIRPRRRSRFRRERDLRRCDSMTPFLYPHTGSIEAVKGLSVCDNLNTQCRTAINIKTRLEWRIGPKALSKQHCDCEHLAREVAVMSSAFTNPRLTLRSSAHRLSLLPTVQRSVGFPSFLVCLSCLFVCSFESGDVRACVVFKFRLCKLLLELSSVSVDIQ